MAVNSLNESKWYEQDGVIYFTVTSNGMNGEQWIIYFEAKGIQISDRAKRILLSSDFQPTVGITTEIAIVKTVNFWEEDRTSERIGVFAAERHLFTLNIEAACLIREMFSDEEIGMMGLDCIVTMHSIKGMNPHNRHDMDFLCESRHYGYPLLDVCHNTSYGIWDNGFGLAFAVSQVSIQS